MAQAPETKSLRIGIIRGGKIVQDQLVKRGTPVTMGKSSKNTFAFPDVAGLSDSFSLFSYRGNQYVMAFTEAMDGRLTVNDNNIDFAALKTQGLAKKEGEAYVMPVAESTRGKVTIGDLTVVFQFVETPPEPLPPQMPPSSQNYWLKSIDTIYLSVMAGSVVLHLALIIYFQTLPIPKNIELAEIPDRFRAILAPQAPKEEEPPPEEEAPTEEVAEAGEEKAAPEKSQAQAVQNSGGNVSSARRDAIREEVAGYGIVALLTAQGEGGAIADVFAEGKGSAGNLDDVMAGIGGVGLATSADLRTTLGGGGGSGTGASIDGLGAGPPGSKKGSEVARASANVSGSLTLSKPMIDGEISAEALTRVVKTGQRAIMACYENELKRNPTLKGRIKLGITINTQGKVAKIDTIDNTMKNPAVENCVTSRMGSWRFPTPKGGEVYVEYPFIFQPAS